MNETEKEREREADTGKALCDCASATCAWCV